MLMTSWNQINTYLVFLVNEAWSSVSASSLMFSPREPCLCVKLFPAAVTLAAMAMGMGNMCTFSVVVSLVHGADGLFGLWAFMSKKWWQFSKVCGEALAFLHAHLFISVVEKDTMPVMI